MVKPGTPVFAICDGVVEFDASKRSNIWDRFLIIKHSSCGQHEVLYGYYGHIDSLVSGVGKRISKGQHIANVKEWPGDIKNTHLHFGISPKWFPKWGYQAGDPLANGWLDPEAFFKEIVTRKPSETPSRDSSKQPSTSPISTLPTGVPSNISRTTLDDYSNRRPINPQQVCEINFPLGSYYYQGSVLGVKHIYESDQIDLVGTHYCVVQYRLDYPGSFMRMFSPSQLFDVNRPRSAREVAVFYNSSKLCYVKYGKRALLVQGKDGTSDHGKIWCEIRKPLSRR